MRPKHYLNIDLPIQSFPAGINRFLALTRLKVSLSAEGKYIRDSKISCNSSGGFLFLVISPQISILWAQSKSLKGIETCLKPQNSIFWLNLMSFNHLSDDIVPGVLVVVEHLEQQHFRGQFVVRDWKFENIVKHWIGIVPVNVGLTFAGVHVRYQKHPDVGVVETALITSGQIVGCTNTQNYTRTKQ